MQMRNLALANAIHMRHLSVLYDKIFIKEDWIEMRDADILGKEI